MTHVKYQVNVVEGSLPLISVEMEQGGQDGLQ